MKVELTLQYLDEWMLRWRKFQTESDWRIERNRQWWRRVDYATAGVLGGCLTLYSSSTATLRRQFGPPHFFDIGIDARIKAAILKTLTRSWRYTPQGFGRVLLIGLPTYLTFTTMEHVHERQRLRQYLRQNTIFGEQARRLVNTGKIMEYLPVDVQATLPRDEQQLYA